MDLSGKEFGRWLVLKADDPRISTDGRTKATWLCRCSCKNEVSVLQESLLSGRSTKCSKCSRIVGVLMMAQANKGKVAHNRYDLTNKKFGKLTVLEEAPPRIRKNGTKQTMWWVRCECEGDNFQILGSALTQKKRPTKQCFSCASKVKIANNLHRFPKGSRPHNYKDLTGTTVGDFLVIGLAGVKEIRSRGKTHQQNCWKTKCILCGNKKEQTSSYFNRKKRCSVCHLKKGEEHARFSGGPLKSLFRSQKRRALKERDMSWSIDYPFFSDTIVKDCFYCGAQANLNSRGMQFYINTLDRYNPDIGYEEENIVPACKGCNLAKRDLHGDAFIELTQRIANHQSNLLERNGPIGDKLFAVK